MKAVKKLEKLRRKAWLAGIAAFDVTVDAATSKLDKIYVDGNAFVNNLIDKGASLEAELQLKLGARSMLDEKISALRARLGMNNESRDQQLDTLSARVDNLIEVVAKLAQQHAAKTPVSKTSNEKLTEVVKSATETVAIPAVKASAVKPVAVPKSAVKTAAPKTVVKKAVTKTPAKPKTVKASVVKPSVPAAKPVVKTKP